MGKNSEGCLVTTSRKEMTRTLFTIKHLEPSRVRMSEMWHAQREKCACVRVRSGVLSNTPRRVPGSCHCLDAKSRKKEYCKSTTMAFQLLKSVTKNVKTAVMC